MMGLGYRVFLIHADDAVQRISLRRFDRIYNGQEAAVEFAGQNIRYLQVAVETLDRRPVRIMHLDCGVLPFDNTGRVDPNARADQMRLVGEMISGGLRTRDAGSLVEARHLFARREFEHKYKWQPTQEILRRVEGIIFAE